MSSMSKKRTKLKFVKDKIKRDSVHKDMYKEKFDMVLQIINPTVGYKKIKYRNEVYTVNDCLLIRDPLVKDGYLIARLLQIIPTNGIEKYPYWPSIQVQWYVYFFNIGFIQNQISIEKTTI
jgi:hypothetical protein